MYPATASIYNFNLLHHSLLDIWNIDAGFSINLLLCAKSRYVGYSILMQNAYSPRINIKKNAGPYISWQLPCPSCILIYLCLPH